MPTLGFNNQNAGSSRCYLVGYVRLCGFNRVEYFAFIFPTVDRVIEHLDFIIRELLAPAARFTNTRLGPR